MIRAPPLGPLGRRISTRISSPSGPSGGATRLCRPSSSSSTTTTTTAEPSSSPLHSSPPPSSWKSFGGPDTIRYQALFNDFLLRNDGKEAADLLRTAFGQGIRPSVSLMNRALSSLTQCNDVDSALDLYSTLKNTVKPDAQTYTILFDGLVKQNGSAAASSFRDLSLDCITHLEDPSQLADYSKGNKVYYKTYVESKRKRSSSQRRRRRRRPLSSEDEYSITHDDVIKTMFTAPLVKIPGEWPDVRVQRSDTSALLEHEQFKRQLVLETRAIQKEVDNYRAMRDELIRCGKTANLAGKKVLLSWYEPLVDRIRSEQDRISQRTNADVAMGSANGARKRRRRRRRRHLKAEAAAPGIGDAEQEPDEDAFTLPSNHEAFLMMLSPEKLAVLTIHCVLGKVLQAGDQGARFTSVSSELGHVVQTEVNYERLLMQDGFQSKKSDSVRLIDKRARWGLANGEWGTQAHVSVGSALISYLLEEANITPELHEFRSTLDVYERRNVDEKDQWDSTQAELSQDDMHWDVSDFPWSSPSTPGASDDAQQEASAAEALEKAFSHSLSHKKRKKYGILKCHDLVKELVYCENVRQSTLMARYLPMVVQPKPWVNPNQGGYLTVQNSMMRVTSKMQTQALKRHNVELLRIFNALNALGETKWRISQDMYEVMAEAWRKGGGIADLPSRLNHALPTMPDSLKELLAEEERLHALRRSSGATSDDDDDDDDGAMMAAAARPSDERYQALHKEKNAWLRRTRRIERKNANLHSLRCDVLYKLEVAKEFQGRTMYFPHNLDFRGRTYPIPPHLNHLGQDLCRGLLSFDQGLPLGERGLFWLKVHLANTYGFDKAPFEKRVAFCEENMDSIFESAYNPLDGNRWWLQAEDPWQCLATCKELMAAHSDGNPEGYVTHFPVHQDGSCNGLQHYAALGGDVYGAEQVNLSPSEVPSDVYSGVVDLVKARIAKEAAAGDELARKLDGRVDRRTIKQTVMTTVYGVTLVGARAQIAGQLEDKAYTRDWDDKDIFDASMYITKHTFEALQEMFVGARQIMTWLSDCAQMIGRQGVPVMWTTPMGLPVVQPYRRKTSRKYSVRTLVQTVTLAADEDDLPVSAQKQRTAFPPNYVHSLDASHMMLTALRCKEEGLSFGSVHDSFWTHPSQVDRMSVILREAFVELHQQPLLDRLLENFQKQHPSVEFPPIPPRGDFDVREVLDSKYFFQ